MKKMIFVLAMSLVALKSNALTCQVQNYEDQSAIVTQTVTNSSQVLLKEGGYRYQVSLVADNRYVLMIIDSNDKAIAAMGIQGYELTLANEALNRTIACR